MMQSAVVSGGYGIQVIDLPLVFGPRGKLSTLEDVLQSVRCPEDSWCLCFFQNSSVKK